MVLRGFSINLACFVLFQAEAQIPPQGVEKAAVEVLESSKASMENGDGLGMDMDMSVARGILQDSDGVTKHQGPGLEEEKGPGGENLC